MPEEVKSSSSSPHHLHAAVDVAGDDSSDDHHPRYLHERESSSRSESSSCSDELTICYKQQQNGHDTSVEIIPTRTLKTSVPKPAANPLQFIKIGPCDLYRSAQQQLKKEKPKKEVKEEGVEDWQSNLDSWKCSRRKQQEHIIERVVEVKKLELEEHDRNRKRTKTFSEMMEERTSKGRKLSLALYPDEDNEDLSDLGLSSNTNKSKSPTIPEENDKDEFGDRNGDNSNGFESDSGTISDDVVDTTITYESAIQNYETRMRALTNGGSGSSSASNSALAKKQAKTISSSANVAVDTKTSSSSSPIVRKFGRRSSAAKIEEKLCELERIKNRSVSSTDLTETNKTRVQIPKVNIFQRKEIFEKGNGAGGGRQSSDDVQQPQPQPQRVRTIKERLSSLQKQSTEDQSTKFTPPSISKMKNAAADVSVKDRLLSINEKIKENTPSSPLPSLPQPQPQEKTSSSPCEEETAVKEFSSGRSSSSEEYEHGAHMHHHYHQHHRSLDSLQGHDSPNGFCFERVQSLESIDCCGNYPASVLSGDTDREDSGIHTADVSSSVSQADDFDLHADSSIDAAVVETKTTTNAHPHGGVAEEVESSHGELVETTVVVAEQNESSRESTAKSEPDGGLLQESKDQIEIDDTLIPTNREQEEKLEIRDNIVIETTTTTPTPCRPSSIETLSEQLTAFEGDVPDGLSPTESVFAFEPSATAVEPPKEKPPPPPVPKQSDDDDDDDNDNELDTMTEDVDLGTNLRRMDSTKRIKKEMRQKRSSFLGIEGFDDDSYLEPELESVKRPPDMTSFLQEERRLEKLLYRQSICSESDSTQGESRDSGVELDGGGGGNRHVDENHWQVGGGMDGHSRQDSETYANTSTTTSEEDELMRKEREILEILELEERQRGGGYDVEASPSKNVTHAGDLGTRLVLKLKELERQKSISWDREDDDEEEEEEDDDEEQRRRQMTKEAESHYDRLPERKQPKSVLLQQQWAGRSLQDVSRDSSTKIVRHSNEHHHRKQPKGTDDYRSSMPNIQQESTTTTAQTVPNQYRVPPPIPPNKPPHLRDSVIANKVSAPQQMSKQTLQALSAVPRSKIMATDSWVLSKKKPRQEAYNYQHWLIQEAEHRRITEYQQRCSGANDTQHPNNNNYANVNVVGQHCGGGGGGGVVADYQESTTTRLNEVPINGGGDGGRLSAAAVVQQQQQQQHTNRSSSHPHTQMLPHRNRNQGFVQEKNNSKSLQLPQQQQQQQQQQQYSKPLPDSVIQTLTQRVQNRLNVHDANKSRRRENYSNGSSQQEKMLSVSGKKKCSHCGEELGRGAAMIIESLRLFYHIDCFKCCVCCVQLGDGLMGTDVRVRNSKLHCHSCYSNDEGVKFSCV